MTTVSKIIGLTIVAVSMAFATGCSDGDGGAPGGAPQGGAGGGGAAAPGPGG